MRPTAGGEKRGIHRRARLERSGGQEALDREPPPREPRQREHRARAHGAPLAGQPVLHDEVGGDAGRVGLVEHASQERRRDLERDVADDAMPLVGKRHEERISLDHVDAWVPCEAAAEPAGQPRVELDRDDPVGGVGERRRQPAGARADLDDEIGPRDAGRGDHLGSEAGASEKVLPVSEPGAMAATSRGHGTSLCRFPSARVYYQTPGTSRAVVAA